MRRRDVPRRRPRRKPAPASGASANGRRPVVGINCSYAEETDRYSLPREYVDAVQEAGGIPMLLPFAAEEADAARILDRLDAVVFTGGNDMNPAVWGEQAHSKAKLLPWFKQRSDEAFARLAIERDLPILAICYGCQLVNVVQGGSLHQHVPDLPDVCDAHRTDCKTHEIELTGTGLLREILGYRSGRVNSFHHQAINRLGRGLKLTALAEDGLPEAIEGPSHRFLIGVQWHPEKMQTHAEQRALFEQLVRHAC
jgi:putative glutamine amidotransferase